MNNNIRTKLKADRQAISEMHRDIASSQISHLLSASPFFQNAQHIAAYWPTSSEIDPTAAIKEAWHLGKNIYLPVLSSHASQKTEQLKSESTPEHTLTFHLYEPNSQLTPNRYGILEPLNTPALPPAQLDLVLVPLLGFHPITGHRLGMGKGYYDRSFAFTLDNTHQSQDTSPCCTRPTLVGLAYPFQGCAFFAQPWDIRLDVVCTPTGFITFTTEH